MAKSSRARKRDTPSEEIVETAGSEPQAAAPPDRDAIRDLLGVPALPVPVRRPQVPVYLPPREGRSGEQRAALIGERGPQWGRRVLVAALLLGIAAPVLLWFHYRAGHATSINAAVRGHVAQIGTRISGRVAVVAVEEGDRVQAGQVLVQLEDRHLLAELEEARAEVTALQRAIQLERVTLDLEWLRIGRLQPEAAARIEAAAARAEAARAQAEAARRNHSLQQELQTRGDFVSSEELNRAASERRAADARLEEAEANAAVTARTAEQETGLAEDAIAIRRRKIAVLEADLLGAQARAARAEAELASASIRAPQRGAIVRRIVQPGGAIDAGQPVIAMWLGDSLWVEAWIDEEDLASVRRGGTATVTFNAFPGREFYGVVERVGIATDLELPDSVVPQPRSSRMRAAPVIGVRIRLDQPPPNLVPGLSAVVAIKKEG